MQKQPIKRPKPIDTSNLKKPGKRTTTMENQKEPDGSIKMKKMVTFGTESMGRFENSDLFSSYFSPYFGPKPENIDNSPEIKNRMARAGNHHGVNSQYQERIIEENSEESCNLCTSFEDLTLSEKMDEINKRPCPKSNDIGTKKALQ